MDSFADDGSWPADAPALSVSELADIVRRIGAAPDLEWAAAEIVKYALELTGARWAEVVDRAHDRSRILASTDVRLSRSIDAARQLTPSDPPLPEDRPVGDRIVINKLSTDCRRPGLQRIAAAGPVRSAVLQYLVVEGRYSAGLAVYDDRVSYFSARLVERLDLLAQVAAPLLAGAAAHRTADQLTTALHTNRTIAAAVGIVMHRSGLDHEAAFAALVRCSQFHNRRLHLIASEIVADPRRALAEIMVGTS